MTSTPVSPVARGYLGQSVTRKEDQRLLTGHGLYVDDVKISGTLHAAFLRSDLARAPRSRVIDTSAAKEMPGVVAVYTWEDFNGITGPGYHAMLGEELAVPPPLAITDVRYVGDPVAVVIADNAVPGRGCLRGDRGRLRAATSRRRLHDGLRRHGEHRPRRLGPRVERDGRRAVHAALPRPRRGLRQCRGRGGVRRRAEPLCGHADGDARDPGLVPCRPAGARHRVRDAVGARNAELLLPIPADPGRQRARHRPRRRRRLRAEDVRVPGGVRGRARFVPARATGQVDRGPA